MNTLMRTKKDVDRERSKINIHLVISKAMEEYGRTNDYSWDVYIEVLADMLYNEIRGFYRHVIKPGKAELDALWEAIEYSLNDDQVAFIKGAYKQKLEED